MQARDLVAGTVDMCAVLEAMWADGRHVMPRTPTHSVWSDTGKLVGAFSVTAAPVLFFWMDSRERSASGCMKAFMEARRILTAMGHPGIILPIQTDSPFYPFISRLGFDLVGPCELWQSR